MAGLIISDRPGESLFEIKDGKASVRKLENNGAPRMFIGKSMDRASVVMLQDARGMPRLLLKVDPDGTSSIEFLDDQGKPVKTIGPAD